MVTTGPEGIRVVLKGDSGKEHVDGTHLLVAAGRKPNLDGLDLEAAGIEYTSKGITVDPRLRTTNKKVFAIGDVAGGYQFTHVASYHAGIVIRNALFRLPAKVNYDAIPWVTFTDPELAHVGQTEQQAREKHGDAARVLKWAYAENDRARAESETSGFVKAIVGPRGRILGATIVGKNAGELLLPWVLALENNLKIGAMANVIAPYPTLSEVSKRAAGSYYTETLFSPKTRRMVRLLQKFA
jgi:pyruvate/2-oxoglutarate dehydrogenase complex dihydrolipoamide dehydrogenase (E3) component